MLKLLFDYQIFGEQRIGGISRYFVELMRNLPQDIHSEQTTLLSENVYLNEFLKTKKWGIINKNFSDVRFRGKGRIYNSINKLNTIMKLKSSKYDIFHPTYYNPYFLNKNKRPYVITVYDMIHEKFSDLYSKTDLTKEFKRKTILDATKIIAISNQTKKDIIELYGVNEEKISVVYLGHSINKELVEKVNNLPENYILYIGSRVSYKNFNRFIQAFAILAKKYAGLHLVCTGNNFNNEEQETFNRLGLADKVHRIFATDAQLNYLYQNAMCFVYPSLYEGFGIPILEAFASSCPLALSNTSCFPEIAQEGGCYFDPYSIDSMVDTISKLIDNTEYREKQIQDGLNVLKQYSWKKMALETAQIYKSI